MCIAHKHVQQLQQQQQHPPIRFTVYWATAIRVSQTHAFVNALPIVERPRLAIPLSLGSYSVLALFVVRGGQGASAAARRLNLGLWVYRIRLRREQHHECVAAAATDGLVVPCQGSSNDKPEKERASELRSAADSTAVRNSTIRN